MKGNPMLRKTGIIIFLLLLGCDPSLDKQTNPLLPTDSNAVQINVGDSWLYRREFINLGLEEFLGIPDTLTGYSFFEVTKDTIIDSLNFLIVEGTDYEVQEDTIRTYQQRLAYHFSDSLISEYTFQESEFGFLSGIMKTRQNVLQPENVTGYSTFAIKNAYLEELKAAGLYDTTVFRDFVTPIRFPLQVDAVYFYREDNDPVGNLLLRKRYIGQEVVALPIGDVQSYVFEYLASQDVPGAEGIIFRDYVSLSGLVKRYLDIGTTEFTDSLSGESRMLQGYDIMELIGSGNIVPDTLVPWGQKQ